jgi:hypothetical protein
MLVLKMADSTKFNDLYPAIRALVGDDDRVVRLFPDWTIDQHIILFALCDTDVGYVVTGVEGERVISAGGVDLTGALRASVVLNAARSLISPVPDYTQMKSPALSTARKGGTSQILLNIDRLLGLLRSESTVVWETELEHFAVGDMRLTNASTLALSASPTAGTPQKG